MKYLKIITIILFVTSVSGCNSNESQQNDSDIKLPPGFKISVYAEEVDGARSMAMSDKGILFVGSRSTGNVYAVVDTNNDFSADEIIIIGSGLDSPNGVALLDGDLYVAEISRVIKFENIHDNLKNPPAPLIVNDSFPTEKHHGWKFVKFGPDGKLYVPVGAPCNICLSEDERFASIMRMNPDGSELEVYVHGVRNTVGFDWHPETNILWFTDNGRDRLGDNIPPDELNRAPVKGLHFGYPFLHGNDVIDPEYGNNINPDDFTLPAQELGPHVAALGMEFYDEKMFPSEYQNQIFIAEHGSWNRSEKIGYRVTLVRLNGSEAVSYETFAEGWLQGETVSGRPVDIEIMSDGSMLVSDDYADVIYRISYE